MRYQIGSTAQKLKHVRIMQSSIFKRVFLSQIVVTWFVYNIYTYVLPSLVSKKYACSDDMTLHTSNSWKSREGVLSQDMTTLSEHLQT